MAEIEPGVQLHYVEVGSGPETMVLVHGYPETWWEWRHVMPIFASAGYRVMAVDYRGAGNCRNRRAAMTNVRWRRTSIDF
jgi:pimeloyl-ACP methyl ester carboxylesterase